MASNGTAVHHEQVNGLTQSTVSDRTTENDLSHPATRHLPSDHSTWSPATLAVHADDPLNILTDVAPPLHVSTTFRYTSDPSKLRPFRASDRPDLTFPFQDASEHVYSRVTTHTSSRLEAILETLLKGPVLTYSCGLSALYAVLVHLNPGRIAIGGGYHGCKGVVKLHSRVSGMKTLPLDCDPSELQSGDLVLCESPLNPTGTAINLSSYAEKAHSRGAYLIVDSTFGPPPLQDPFLHGADLVMHSGTKYIGGHSDLLCGVIAVAPRHAKEWIPKMLEDREFLGSVMGSMESWLGVRSLRTLELRVKRQSTNADWLVDALNAAVTGASNTPGVHGVLTAEEIGNVKKVIRQVHHCSLQKSDMKWLAKQMPQGGSPVFAVSCHGEELARTLPSKLALFHHATSLGGVESLIEWRTMSDATCPRDLLRISVGVEGWKDLLADLVQACATLAEEFKL